MGDFTQNKSMRLYLSPTRGPFLLVEIIIFSTTELVKYYHKNVLVKYSHMRKPFGSIKYPLAPIQFMGPVVHFHLIAHLKRSSRIRWPVVNFPGLFGLRVTLLVRPPWLGSTPLFDGAVARYSTVLAGLAPLSTGFFHFSALLFCYVPLR